MIMSHHLEKALEDVNKIYGSKMNMEFLYQMQSLVGVGMLLGPVWLEYSNGTLNQSAADKRIISITKDWVSIMAEKQARYEISPIA